MSSEHTIGHYRIISKLGEGGMGEVYRAADTKLNRDVAIKVLPKAFAADAARMARFEREAQVLASLNHPNIAAIYGVEQGALVMELVEGADLSGPLPVERAIEYARQIAAGLDAAHEKGIVHRDLKPANIRVTADGVVKLLDFGLAATNAAPAARDATASISLTQEGTILGTAAYMAPEQAAGKAVDKRADIWAFGVVLYEMLTGTRLFEGETSAHTLANVMAKEFDLGPIAPSLRPLLRRCLQRDPRMRLRDIGDARLMLEDRLDTPVMGRRNSVPWAVAAAAVVLATLAAGSAWFRPKPIEPETASFGLATPENAMIDPGSLALPQSVPSPDGRFIAFAVRDIKASQNYLWVRPLRSPAAYRIEKSEGANTPFWSPDSGSIGFIAEGKLKRAPVSGGVPLTIVETNVSLRGATWNAEGTIVFSSGTGELRRVAAAGGPDAPVSSLDPTLGEDRHGWPQFLPDGNHLIYFAGSRDPEKCGIYVTEIGSPARTLLLRSRSRAVFAPPGYLLFVREGALLAQGFHPQTFQLKGGPATLARAVMEYPNGNASFAASANVLVFRTGAVASTRQLGWYSREGKTLNTIGSPGEYANISLSPDGQRVALRRGVPRGFETWVMETSSGAVKQVTSELSLSFYPAVWSPDSRQIAISSIASSFLRTIVVATGAATDLPPNESACAASDWTRDGRFLLCAGLRQVSLLPIEPQRAGAQQEPKVLLVASVPAGQLHISPDGRWVAYGSEESGERQVWVASFPAFADRRLISIGGGTDPIWRNDGKELFFLAPGAMLMSAGIRPGSRLEFETPRPLFKANLHYPGLSGQFAVSKDGQRFLIAELGSNIEKTADTVVLNWSAGLKP